MAPPLAHERPRPLLIHPLKFHDFNIRRLIADKAMHSRDYRAQLELAAYGHGEPKEFSGLSAEIKKSMAALC